ncbi:MAG: hypothetical protein ACFBSC_15995 [Microcoleaceae cyanobacterium]
MLQITKNLFLAALTTAAFFTVNAGISAPAPLLTKHLYLETLEGSVFSGSQALNCWKAF